MYKTHSQVYYIKTTDLHVENVLHIHVDLSQMHTGTKTVSIYRYMIQSQTRLAHTLYNTLYIKNWNSLAIKVYAISEKL